MEISTVILSCYPRFESRNARFFLLLIMICNLNGFRQIKKYMSTLNYLRSADACLTRTRTVMYWLSAPAITDSANKCHAFDGQFNQKSMGCSTMYD